MRYLVGFVLVLGLVASPLSASAQDNEAGTTSEPSLEESAPPSEPALEEPALQLKLDDAGVEVVPSPPRTPNGYTLEEMDVRVRRAKIGLGVSGGVFLAGVVMGSIYLAKEQPFSWCWTDCPPYSESVHRAGWAGVALTSAGFVGMITSGILLRRRKRDRDSLREERPRTSPGLDEEPPAHKNSLRGPKYRPH